jgi:hypothetical protein
MCVQAWGLTELERGNVVGSMKLIERCVYLDPSNAPVMRWKPVLAATDAAKLLIKSRRKSLAERINSKTE